MKYMSKINEINELKREFVTRLIVHMSQNEVENDKRFEKMIEFVSFPSKLVIHLLRSLLDSVKKEEYLIARQLKNEMIDYIEILDS